MKPFILVWLTTATGRRRGNDPLALRVVESIRDLRYLFCLRHEPSRSQPSVYKRTAFLLNVVRLARMSVDGLAGGDCCQEMWRDQTCVLTLTCFQVTVTLPLIASYAFPQAACWCHICSADPAQPASAKWRPQTIRLAMVITHMSRRNAQRLLATFYQFGSQQGRQMNKLIKAQLAKSPQQYQHK